MNCKKYEIICEANRHWLKIIYLYKNSHVFPVHYCTVDCYSLHLTSPVPVQATTTSQEDYTPHFLPHAFAVPSPMRDGVYFPILVMLVLTTWLISANGNIKKASCVSTCPLMPHSSPGWTSSHLFTGPRRKVKKRGSRAAWSIQVNRVLRGAIPTDLTSWSNISSQQKC